MGRKARLGLRDRKGLRDPQALTVHRVPSDPLDRLGLLDPSVLLVPLARLARLELAKQIAYAERVPGWNAFTSDNTYANIEGLTVGFTLPDPADVTIKAGGFNAIIVTAGVRVRIAVLVDGVRKLTGQVQAGTLSGSSQWLTLSRLERTLHLAAGYHYVQVQALHQTSGSVGTTSGDALWTDLSNFSGLNDESAMTMEAAYA
jgi:hypothetical protein